MRFYFWSTSGYLKALQHDNCVPKLTDFERSLMQLYMNGSALQLAMTGSCITTSRLASFFFSSLPPMYTAPLYSCAHMLLGLPLKRAAHAEPKDAKICRCCAAFMLTAVGSVLISCLSPIRTACMIQRKIKEFCSG